METNTRDFIERAEHCIRTNQPNLGLLYMENALKHNAIDRIQNKTGKPVEDFWESMSRILKPVSEAFASIGEGLVKTFKDFAKSYGEALREENKKETEGK